MWPCFREDSGSTLEFGARKAIECSKCHELFCGSLGDKNCESNADDGGLAYEVPKWSSRVRDCQRCSLFWVESLWFWSAGAEEAAVINRRPEPLKWNLCFPGTAAVVGQLKLRLAVITERPADHQGEAFREVLPGRWHTEARGGQHCASCSELNVGMWLHPGGTGVEGKQDSGKAAEARVLEEVQPQEQLELDSWGVHTGGKLAAPAYTLSSL